MTGRRLRTIDDLGDLEGRRVLVRVDFNVPLDGGRITDDTRIRAALPTIELLRGAGASLVLCSHLGRPKGKVVEELRMDPVADRLSELLPGVAVRSLGLASDPETRDRISPAPQMEVPSVGVLENLRFDPGETTNDPALAEALAALGEAYVNDAFGAAHRAHASVVGITERLPSAAGLLMQREVEILTRLRDAPERPFAAVLGGAKVSDKLGVVRALLDRVDVLVVGGAMAFTFLVARGGEVGDSLVEEDQLEDVRTTLKEAEQRGIEIVLPRDVVAAREISAGAESKIVPADDIPPGWKGLDVGPRSVASFAQALSDARTVFWNGPMGVFEIEDFASGTRGVAEAVAAADAFTVVGGGDSLAAIRSLGFEDRIDHLSTGGGASLELLEGRELPGLKVLMEDA